MTGESTAKDIAKEFKKEGFHVTIDSTRSLKVTSPIYGVTAYYKKYSNSFGDSKWEMMEFNRKKPVYLNREDVHNNEYNEWMDKLNDVHKKMFSTELSKKTSNNLTKQNESNKISSPSQAEAGKSGDNKMSVNIENPVYDVTLGLSKKDFGMQELKKVIKESGDEAGIIFATNYVEKNMDNNPFGAEELLNFANKKTKKAAKEKAKLEKEEAAKLAETQAQEQKADKYLAEYGGLEGAKAYALSVGFPQEAVDKAFDTAKLALSNNLELIKSKLFNFKKAGKGDLEIIEKAKESQAAKQKNENEYDEQASYRKFHAALAE